MRQKNMEKPRIMDLEVQNALMRSSQASEHMHGDWEASYIIDRGTGRAHCRVCWAHVPKALLHMAQEA